MAIPLLPIIKAVAPHVAKIALSSIPSFTSKPAASAKADPVIARQIEELQGAVTQNAESIQVLADNLTQALQGIEDAAVEAKRQAAATRSLALAALGFSCAALLIGLFALLR